jgi:hypothetical protein
MLNALSVFHLASLVLVALSLYSANILCRLHDCPVLGKRRSPRVGRDDNLYVEGAHERTRQRSTPL